MTKKFNYMAILFVGVLMSLASCQHEILPGTEDVPEGYMKVRFSAEIPDMQTVATRSVDGDGAGIQNIVLFCFDAYGVFITVTDATITSGDDDLSGTLDAKIPGNTRGIHFLANQNMTNFKESQFRNLSATEVIGVLEGSSGRMIYWQRFVPDGGATMTNEEFKDALEASDPIKFIRNHAFVSVSKDDTDPFTVTGFVVYNSNAFGTVAPYHTEMRFDWDWASNVWTEGCKRDDQLKFVNLPANRAKMSGIEDVSTSFLTITKEDGTTTEKIHGQYIFEDENPLQNPVSVILKGYNTDEGKSTEKYYRVMLQDKNGEMLPIRRNHHYQINIAGKLTNGQPDFAAATKAAATNNIWIAISPDIKEVADASHTLAVEQTAYVYTAGTVTSADVLFNIKDNNSTTAPSANNLKVSWIGENNTVSDTYDLSVQTAANSSGATQYPLATAVTSSIDGKSYNGKVTLNLTSLGANESMREGVLLIKYGQLQRQVRITVIKEQEFKPTWISTQVYAGEEGSTTLVRDKVTFIYTIPEDTPKALFPMKVLLSVNNLDVRSASGMSLPVVKKEDDEYVISYNNNILDPDASNVVRIYAKSDAANGIHAGDVTDKDGDIIGYKYVHEIKEPGVQRVYFENILNTNGGADVQDIITVEANHFKPVTKRFTFSQLDYNIRLENVHEYSAKGANDDHIKYLLVPPKANAHVQIDFSLRNGEAENAGKVSAATTDEFLLYSSHLDNYTLDDDGMFVAGGTTYTSQATFTPINSDNWGTGGRVFMFQPIEAKTDYSIYLKTNCAKSAEVVRISSNDKGSSSGSGSGTYNGNVFRSVTFELSNYKPFTFAATVNGTDMSRPVEISYLPEQEVNIAFDITSYTSNHEDTTIPNISVDPFGSPFEVYIDAPMLEIGTLPDTWKNKYSVTVTGEDGTLTTKTVNKLRASESVPGRFIYIVDANRATERGYFTESGESAKIQDEKAVSGAQVGERKSLPFKLKKDVIVSEGEIVISADPKMVSYTEEKFKLVNIPISGTITYDGTPIAEGKFVAFEKISDNSRIGAVAVGQNGSYTLKLRQEYSFSWLNDPVQFIYEHRDKNEVTKYKVIYDSLYDLYKSMDENGKINVNLSPAI